MFLNGIATSEAFKMLDVTKSFNNSISFSTASGALMGKQSLNRSQLALFKSNCLSHCLLKLKIFYHFV
jgi:hypothetical protein